MTAPTKPNIDEQIEYVKGSEDGFWELTTAKPVVTAILSTLRAHKAIMEAKRPEPVNHRYKYNVGGVALWTSEYRGENGLVETQPLYGPDLLAYADRMESAYKMAHQQAMENGEKRLVAQRQLAELQQKTQHLVEPQNPCNCVPDGDDGTVAHLCHWHKTTLGKAYRMQNMANTLTVENIAKLPMDKLRLWIAHGIQESTARKRAEERLAELQAKHNALVKRLREPSEKMLKVGVDVTDEFTYLCERQVRDAFTAMSAVALDKGGE